MGLIARLIGNEEPKAGIHDWPKGFSLYKRNRLALHRLDEEYLLALNDYAVAQVITSTNKLGLYVGHDLADDVGVYLASTGTIPGGLLQEDAKGVSDPMYSKLYYVRDSNPAQGTVKLAEAKGGVEVDITDTGAGTHTIRALDPDFIFWEESRKSLTSSLGLEDQKLRRMQWDEVAEGVGAMAELRVDFVTEQEFKDELDFAAAWMTVP